MMSSKSEKAASELAYHQQLLSRLEKEPNETQFSSAQDAFTQLLVEAGKPKAVAGTATMRISAFVENCSKSDSQPLREWAFSRDVTQQLFTLYMEWNELDQQRSMKLILDVIIQLQKGNPDTAAAYITRKSLLQNLISIIIGKSTKPVAKSAIKTLDSFLSKAIYTVDDIRLSYIEFLQEQSVPEEVAVWQRFFNELFAWMKVQYVCPMAGRFIVSMYRQLRNTKTRPQAVLDARILRIWLLDFLKEDLSLLEAVKNYVFVPLFDADRPEALEFLRMDDDAILSTDQYADVDIPAMLQLAALETGKRIGLVEEPALDVDIQESQDTSSIILHENILNNVLAHPSQEVRTLAFSLLITSPSTTRPYSSAALELLKRHLGTYFADSDAKFRVDIMAKARDMFKRVRGAILVLKRSIPRARAKANKQKTAQGEKGTAPIVYRTKLIDLPEEQLSQCLDWHTNFLKWYIGFLCSELTPTSSYQRHVASLKALAAILKAEADPKKSWETDSDQEIFFDLLDESWVRALFDCVMDRFEDVREFASTALKTIYSDGRYRNFTLSAPESKASPAEELNNFSNRAAELARRTARADHSDGVSRACQLAFQFSGDEGKRLEFMSRLIDGLEGKLGTAENNLGQAVLDSPIHGDFAALRLIWQVVSSQKFSVTGLETVRLLQERLITCCERIWSAVREILCDDSPEGHLPQELEEMEGINTKDVLSYSFRAIHESSNLTRTIVLTLRNRSKQEFINPSPRDFEKLGDLSFLQLSTLRHRGAFSTVSSTFSTCCQQTRHLEDVMANGKNFLQVWYQGTLDAIFSQASTTRRSAGIPSLMTGILSANASHPSFEEVMEKLMEISSTEALVRETDGSNLPQVHAFNCLKDIFRNSLLTSIGNKSESYLPQCLELAANGLRSEVWAIRNCALILLRSLIDCLFGSGESKTMIEAGWDGKANRIAYHRYPTLSKVLVNLLKSGHQMMSITGLNSAGAESVFPALDIVRRAGPPDALREELQIYIAAYLASPVWHVREMAARTLCSCLLHDKWFVVLKDLLHKALDDDTKNSQNRVHGVLLAFKFVIERLSEVAPELLSTNLSSLFQTFERLSIDTRYQACPDILAAFVEVVNLTWGIQLLESRSPNPMALSLPTRPESALLKIQHTKYTIFGANLTEYPIKSLEEILLGTKLGVNTMIIALDTLPQIWNSASSSPELLAELCGLYVNICLENSSREVQTMALENLADILEYFLDGKASLELLQPLPIQQLLQSVSSQPINTSLSYAALRASGSLAALLRHFGRLSPHGLQNWGIMVADAGLEDNTFDGRFAAARSLQAFFSSAGAQSTSDESLPALIALYDALNDDDDEVRDVGSVAVKSIIGQVLVPIEAANRLIHWLTQNFGQSALFRDFVTTRVAGFGNALDMHGPWESAKEQLDAALKADDSLFLVEDQNLFVDEVREAHRWVSAYESMTWTAEDAASQKLNDWVQDGLERLKPMVNQDDGPLGWASDPDVFYTCSQIILAAVVLERKGQASEKLRGSLKDLREVVTSQSRINHQISGLLIKYLE